MKKSYFMVFLIAMIFFVISLLTNILGALNPSVKISFSLSDAQVALLPFAFFIAYGVMSIPAGVIVERFNQKLVLAGSFVLALGGSFAFAARPSFGLFIFSLFLIGIGMAVLQVAINPLLRVAGGEEHFAFFSVVCQLVFGLAGIFGPKLHNKLIEHLDAVPASGGWIVNTLGRLVPPQLHWVAIYWIFSAATSIMVIICAVVKWPRIELKDDERAGALSTYIQLFQNKTVVLFFIGIFAYVGTEQGVSFWSSEFLQRFHHFSDAQGSDAVAYFWGLMSVGCVAGLVLLKLFDSRKILMVFVLAAMITLAIALYGPPKVSLWAFPIMGFFLSVMWPIVFSLALNSIDKHHGSFAGILCTGIIGGALVQLFIGKLSNWVGLRGAMTMMIYLTLSYIMFIAIWARPLINNATILQKSAEEVHEHV